MTEPCELSAVEARRLIGLKKLSPVELLESCLKRIGAVNGAVNAIVAMDEAGARKEARQAEAAVMKGGYLRLLHGLPVGVKDLEPVKGLRSTWGSLLFKDHVPDADAPMVASVRKHGANILAKTNTPEFGAGANTKNRVYGATGNPFDPMLSCAGSSGGSAVALALDMVPIATGSDYGGSLRTPAAFCGVVGFRPSPGLVPNAERIAGLIPWGVLGPMGRSVADAHLLLRAQLHTDARDPFNSADSLTIPSKLAPADLASVKAAVTPDFGCAPVDREIARVFKARSKTLAGVLGAVEEATPDFAGVHEVFEAHRGLSFVAAHQEKLARHRDLLGPNVIDNTERGLKLSIAEVGRAFAEQTKIYKRVLAFFEDYDVLIAPAASVSPFPHEKLYMDEINGERMPTYMRWLAISYIPTKALCCACVIPCGVDHKGLPFGIQIIGAKGSDARVLKIALALEQVLSGSPETARPKPDLGKLARSMHQA